MWWYQLIKFDMEREKNKVVLKAKGVQVQSDVDTTGLENWNLKCELPENYNSTFTGN